MKPNPSVSEITKLFRGGICSVCSAHPWVIEAAMRDAEKAGKPVLIEATCNQVNQDGGYTGLTPALFRAAVETIADRIGFPRTNILLGGDHLGPHPWSNEDAARAMPKAEQMVRLYVEAGFCKIHLDASMPCAGENAPLPDEVIAHRAARLCAAAEAVRGDRPIVYIIGTEVPTPGGALDEEPQLQVTRTEAAAQAISTHKSAFAEAGLQQAWERVIALVVQPGVEFAHDHVHDFEPAAATELTRFLSAHPQLVYEAHSTDYQRPGAYKQLVDGGFRILKVGPALTYAMRQALFALATMEDELLPPEKCSALRETLDQVMVANPSSWRGHYHGTEREQQLLRVHSYSDRIRYYWNDPEVQASVYVLLENLERTPLPETMLSDYLPTQYAKVRAGALQAEPVALILDAIAEALAPYRMALD